MEIPGIVVYLYTAGTAIYTNKYASKYLTYSGCLSGKSVNTREFAIFP